MDTLDYQPRAEADCRPSTPSRGVLASTQGMSAHSQTTNAALKPNQDAAVAPLSRPATRCRMCHGSNLEVFLDLGLTPLADEFRPAERIERGQVYFPLEVMTCLDCGQAQLTLVVAPEVLYQDDYPYESSTTAAGRTHFAGLARSVVADYRVGPEQLAIDIGSNVGVLVRGFLDAGVRGLGIEPAPNIAEIAAAQGIETVAEFFGPETAHAVRSSHGEARVLTATNVFAHVDDLDAFMEGVDVLLSRDGLLVIEAPHFLQLVRELEYDTIYHEHLTYLAVRPLVGFFRRTGFELIDVQQVGIHGGSCRLFVARPGVYDVSARVAETDAAEAAEGLYDPRRLHRFADDVARHRLELLTLLLRLKAEGKRIAGVSAPAKGMTLLNYCGIDRGILDFVTEKSMLKVGRFTPGGRIPVRPDSDLVERGIDFGLLLAWNFAEEIMTNLSAYRAAGGRFIVPIPSPRVV